jgi:two-component SAPR family response regulator
VAGKYKGGQMISLLLAGQEEGNLSGLSNLLGQDDHVSVLRADSCEVALDLIHYQKVNFVIVDEQFDNITGLQFVKELVAVNPMINCALVSSMTPEDFHEATEGLGIMAQLPTPPGEKQVEDLMQRLQKILEMTN